MRSVFDIPQKKQRILDIQDELENPNIWKDYQKAQQKSKELVELKETVEAVEKLQKEYNNISEIAKVSKDDEKTLTQLGPQLEQLAKEIQGEEIRVFLSGKYDRGNAVLTVTAGAGGQDAEDWAQMLLRMYERYAERKKWKTALIHERPGQASIEIGGSFAYGLLKREQGVHRLVRISPFSAKALRHTSFAAVDVLPEIRQEEEHIEIKPEDIQIEVSRSSGPGGQNVNKRETAVRIVHIATGVAVESQTQRSQQQNKERALEILAAKLYQLKERERKKELEALGQVQDKPKAIEWGSQIRSYVLHPYQMVKDHRTQVETSSAARVLDGALDEFIEAEISFHDS